MNLLLVRYCYGPDHVAGLLKFGDELQHSVWTLECPYLNNQPFISSIPDGQYGLIKFDSKQHPGCWVLTPVPNRTGILIHVGNEVEHTQGCILIGQTQKPGWVGNSRDALRQLNYYLDRAEQHTIQIGPGLGAIPPDAVQLPDAPPDSVQGGSHEGNGDGGVPPTG